MDIRQGLVDEFTEDDAIPVFLLSTKAGGMGINLTAASVVILFDQDFNPHNDHQATGRASRIGQRRDVKIVKLVSHGIIEEGIFSLVLLSSLLQGRCGRSRTEVKETAGMKTS